MKDCRIALLSVSEKWGRQVLWEELKKDPVLVPTIREFGAPVPAHCFWQCSRWRHSWVVHDGWRHGYWCPEGAIIKANIPRAEKTKASKKIKYWQTKGGGGSNPGLLSCPPNKYRTDTLLPPKQVPDWYSPIASGLECLLHDRFGPLFNLAGWETSLNLILGSWPTVALDVELNTRGAFSTDAFKEHWNTSLPWMVSVDYGGEGNVGLRGWKGYLRRQNISFNIKWGGGGIFPKKKNPQDITWGFETNFRWNCPCHAQHWIWTKIVTLFNSECSQRVCRRGSSWFGESQWSCIVFEICVACDNIPSEDLEICEIGILWISKCFLQWYCL